MKSPAAQKQSALPQRSIRRRIFSSEARYVRTPFIPANDPLALDKTPRSTWRNEQWIYL